MSKSDGEEATGICLNAIKRLNLSKEEITKLLNKIEADERIKHKCD